jgi:hypothetical protein
LGTIYSMSLFNNDKEQLKEAWILIERLLSIIDTQAETIRRCCCKHKVKLLLIDTKTQNPMSTTSFATNQKVIGTLSLVDQVTGLPVTASFTGTAAAVDNLSVAAAVVNADGTVTISGVSAGTVNVTVTTTAAYTDSTGTAQSVPLTLAVAVTVTAVVVADTVSLVITFSTPIAQ